MRVRFLKGCVAENENYNAGEEADLGGSLAVRLMAWGLVVKVDTVEAPPPESDPPVAASRKRTR